MYSCRLTHELNELFVTDWGPVVRRDDLLDSEVVVVVPGSQYTFKLWYGGVFQSFRVSAAVRPHHQAISARAREKGAIRSDLGQTKAGARPPVKKGRTAAPVPKTRRPIRDSD